MMVLLAVILGALVSTGTQLRLEKKRAREEAERAKQLVAGELFHAQIVLRDVSRGAYWPPVEDVTSYLTSSAWQENRSRLSGTVPTDLFDKLVMTYARLELDRARFGMANRVSVLTPLASAEASALRETANHLGRLRRELGGGDFGWLDDLPDKPGFGDRPLLANLERKPDPAPVPTPAS
jgi:hypothetical protein